jgi:RNA recognition motif-containing protein
MSNKLYVAHLPRVHNLSKLTNELFSKFGLLKKVVLFKLNGNGPFTGCGFVEFNRAPDAQNALRRLNRSNCMGKILHVSVYKSKNNQRTNTNRNNTNSNCHNNNNYRNNNNNEIHSNSSSNSSTTSSVGSSTNNFVNPPSITFALNNIILPRAPVLTKEQQIENIIKSELEFQT